MRSHLVPRRAFGSTGPTRPGSVAHFGSDFENNSPPKPLELLFLTDAQRELSKLERLDTRRRQLAVRLEGWIGSLSPVGIGWRSSYYWVFCPQAFVHALLLETAQRLTSPHPDRTSSSS